MKIELSCPCGATFSARGIQADTRGERWQLMHPCTVRAEEYRWVQKITPTQGEPT